MRFIVFFLFCVVCTWSALGEIIPSSRRAAWQGNVGLFGGIPYRTVIYKNLVTDSGADNTGVADCTSILQSAITSCPPGQVVYLPAGRYRLNGCVLNPSRSNVTIRGAGLGKTILDLYGQGCNGVINIGTQDWPPPTADITIQQGATAGSTTITCDSTAGIAAGKLIRIEQMDLTWVKPLNGFDNRMSFIFKVTAVNGQAVSFWPPLPFTLTNSPQLAVYPTFPILSVGIEDLTFEMQNAPDLGAAVFIEQAYGCWLRNIEVLHSNHRQIWFALAMNCEVRHCYIHDVQSFSSNREGIDLYENACWNLIEDNISVRGGYPMIVLGDWKGSCSGNVIAYNYCVDAQGGGTVAASAISDNHGSHNMMNLIEGNIAQMFESDGYWGGSSHGTLLRNWFSGKYADQLYNHVAIKLNHFADYYNVVGNILGDPTVAAAYETEVNGYPSTLKLIYRLGFPFIGAGNYTGAIPIASPPDYTAEPDSISIEPQRFDPNVRNTIIRHGNYDFATKGVVWNPGIADHQVPNSYYLTGKPSWFGALVWPAFEPANAANLANMTIPAQYRFLHGIDVPIRVVSRKQHGSAGTFDIDLPLSGAPGVECRSGGATKDYQIIVTFLTPIASLNTAVTTGVAQVKRNGVSMIGTEVTVDLTNVGNAQTIQLQVSGVSNGANFNITVPIRVLAGDATGNGAVNSSDLSLVKARAGQPVNASTFRTDVTASGTINASDVAFVKSKSGTFAP